MIRVNEKEVKLIGRMTIADAIRKAGFSTGEGTIVMVDGEVLSKEELSQEAESDANIRVMLLVSGG
jgi:sulfur carrier protein ThiS